jgi:hypothetical protein
VHALISGARPPVARRLSTARDHQQEHEGYRNDKRDGADDSCSSPTPGEPDRPGRNSADRHARTRRPQRTCTSRGRQPPPSCAWLCPAGQATGSPGAAGRCA